MLSIRCNLKKRLCAEYAPLQPFAPEPCILSWRVFWMTILNRTVPDASPQLALTGGEIRLLDHLVNDIGKAKPRGKTLSHYLTKLARLGGYLARASDPPPGDTVMWRGLSRLTDIEIGAEIGTKFVGN
jgi:hypothetical protein